ncbi:Glyoxalase-like domain-containing protein [Aphelenchoides bicaudatus]|nr:Glyoxalase-like domain-containing protein [Aphelenchoides bicaudatus]
MPADPHQPKTIHYVFRIADRKKAIDFYKNTLLMHVLRHEEFEGGCAATCNGPYSGNWSKTMIGYGHEKDHYVLELTYNYGIKHYDLGNDFEAIHIESQKVYDHVKDKAEKGPENSLIVRDPDGHKYFIYPGETEYPVKRVSLNTKDLKVSKQFWEDIIGLKEVSHSDHNAVLAYPHDPCQLELRQLPPGVAFNRGTAFGRYAIAYPTEWQVDTENKVKSVNPNWIHTSRVTLPTPGKVDVHVLVLRSPDDQEIGLVSATEMWILSEQLDHNADQMIEESIAKHKE